jgi:DNA (cytosine-5)-methyltransferase 1
MSSLSYRLQCKKNDSLKRERNIYAIDLFCGAGGLTYGLSRAGIKVSLGVDIDLHCKYPYTANNDSKFLSESVETLNGEKISRYFRKNSIRLLAGCAPCQTFSTYNQKANDSDRRWWLLRDFSRLVGELSPELVTMENVPGLATQNVFKDFVADLERKNYRVKFQVVNCEEYGVPQHRNRLVLLASKFGPVDLISPEVFGRPRQTVRKAISKLPAIGAGTNDSKDLLHLSSSLSDLNMKRIKASKPGGTWRDWPDELVADCHKKSSGRTYPSVYGRMTWDDPAPTITTEFFGFGNGRFGHPEQDRAISLREGAILQSFPLDYKFVEPGKQICLKSIGRLIGNAVPVTLGEAIGESLFLHVSSIPPETIKKIKESRK